MGLSQGSHCLLLAVTRPAEGGLDTLESSWKHRSWGRGGFTQARETSLISR